VDDKVERADAGRMVGGGGESDGIAVDEKIVGDLHELFVT
jgi:hypothetical protein